jgi:hypothetical protein
VREGLVREGLEREGLVREGLEREGLEKVVCPPVLNSARHVLEASLNCKYKNLIIHIFVYSLVIIEV